VLTLAGKVVIVTGAGGGIGLAAARSILKLGGSVVLAELDASRVRAAAEALDEPERVLAAVVDVGDAVAVRGLAARTIERFGKVDAVINNATYAPAGAAVVETPIADWDRSYAVNLRGPAVLARECLPAMIARGSGVFVCVSSTGGPFLAPYETLKAAQVELASSLDAELDGTGVIAFTIGPGLVPTATAVAAIERIAPRLGMTVDEFWRMNKGAVLSVESAGMGFAAAIAMAERYAGQEISSSQALIDAGLAIPDLQNPEPPPVEAVAAVTKTLARQVAGWKQRSFFERQWMLREFRQRVGMPVERCLETLESGAFDTITLEKLEAFYLHMGDLARGYVKDPAQRDEQVAITAGWVAEVRLLREARSHVATPEPVPVAGA